MPRPTFAVLRTAQQPVHHAEVGIRRRVRKKGVQFLARRRQANEIEINTAQQHGPVRGRERFQSAHLLFGRDEGVDGIPVRVRAFDLGHYGTNGGQKRPMLARIRLRLLVFRGDRALFDPGFEQLDLLRFQWLAFRRHALFLVGRGHSCDQGAFVCVAGTDGQASLTPLANQGR